MALQFGSYEFQVSISNGQHFIFDIVRMKKVRLTPEESVRQTVIQFFIHDLKFPASYISVEKSLEVNGLLKRTDIVVYNKDLRPSILVECKEPEVHLDEGVAKQAATYNMTLQAPWLLITNGRDIQLFEIDHKKKESHPADNFPSFDDL